VEEGGELRGGEGRWRRVSDKESGESEKGWEAESVEVLTQQQSISGVTLTVEQCVFDGVEGEGRSGCAGYGGGLTGGSVAAIVDGGAVCDLGEAEAYCAGASPTHEESSA
jgi:hypothetical protein